MVMMVLETFRQVGIVVMMLTVAVIVVVMMLATFVVMVILVSLNDFGLLRKAENEVLRVRMPDYTHTA